MDIFKQLKDAVGSNKLMDPINKINQIAKTVDYLRTLLTDNKVSESVKEMIKGLMTLITTKPNIAGINHYFNHLLLKLDPENQPPVLKELLEVYHERWKNVDRRTAQVAYELIDLKKEPIILLHGSEKSVTSLFELMMVNQLKATIYQTLTRPNEKGKEQSIKLAEIGYEIQLIDDHVIGTIMTDIDYVLIGCELILNNEFVGDAGTLTLMTAAKYFKKPVYILGDSRKILNANFFPQNVLNNMIGEGKRSSKTIWNKPPKGIKVESFSKEQIPNYFVEKFVFEDGHFTPEELKDQIDKVMVKKFF